MYVQLSGHVAVHSVRYALLLPLKHGLSVCLLVTTSGVTTRGEVRQLPQGAKRQGALWADGLFALLLNF